MRDDDSNQERVEKRWEDRAPARTTRWLVILGLLFLAVVIFGGGYVYEQGTATSDLAAQNQTLHSTVDQMRNQVGELTAKLDKMSTPPPAQVPPAVATGATASKRVTSSRSAAEDRRIKNVQSQLSEQRQQLKETQDQLASAKSDLEGKLGSTRDELNGSIAKTHEELMGLEKRGERRYYEFDLSKSKGFQREGPIQVSLRKADSKHQTYDIMMMVNDHQLSKKKVDLYEPIWFHDIDQPQPVQIVVNKIEKDRVHGYVSAARYKESDLVSSSSQPSAGTPQPISTPASTSSSSSSSTTPTQSPATSPEGQE